MRWMTRSAKKRLRCGRPERWFAWYPVLLCDNGKGGTAAWLEMVYRVPYLAVRADAYGGDRYENLHYAESPPEIALSVIRRNSLD